MFGPMDFVLGGLAPLAASALAFAIAWRLWRRSAVAWSIGLIVGYAAGMLALNAREDGLQEAALRLVKASESHDWLPLLALAAAAPMAIAAVARRPWLEELLAAPVCVVAPLALLWRKYSAIQQRAAAFATNDAITPVGAALILAAIAAATLVAWSLWRRAGSASSLPRTRTLLSVFATTGAAAAAALTGALVYGQALGVLAAALSGCAAACWLAGEASGPEAARGPALVIFGGLIAASACYSDLLIWQAAALGAAMVLPVGWLPRVAALKRKRQAALRTALCLVPLTIVLWQAVDGVLSEQQREQEESDDPYSSYEAM